MGDLNAKIGKDNDWRGIMGTEGLGQMNENWLLFASFCALNELVIGGSLFPHKQTHKATRISPDHHVENQTEFRRVLLDVRVKRGADIDSDHHLLMGELRKKLAEKKKPGKRVQRRFETRKLKDNTICQEWGIHLRNRFQALAEGDKRGLDHRCNLESLLFIKFFLLQKGFWQSSQKHSVEAAPTLWNTHKTGQHHQMHVW